MPNPKDWFRRRRSAALDETAADHADPFAGEDILELDRSTAVLTPPALNGDGRLSAAPERAGPVPPPPRAPLPRRDPLVLDRSAFAVRPEILKPREPTRPEPARPETRPPYAAPPTAAPSPFAIRRGGAAPAQPALKPLDTILPAEAKPAPEPRPPAEIRPLEPKPVDPPHDIRRPQEAPPSGSPPARGDLDQAAFTLAAPGVSWKRTRPNLPEGARASALLRDAFTPTRPKQTASLFSGRFKQMQRIIAAIEEERAHVMVYGERGSGKTSLANVLAAKAEEAGYLVLRFACSSELSFEDIFRNFLRRMPATLLPDGIGATSRAGIDNFEQLLPEHFGVPELISAFDRIHERHVILIIDEYDRVVTEDTKAKLAELIKNMSDAAAPVTLLIIGVAENVSQLLGKHPSLQRTVVTVPMPLMSRRELDGIIGAGEEKSGLHFDPWVRQSIADFAQGLPYHAQLLCLFAARSAVRRQSVRIDREDLRYAIQRCAEEAEARTKEAYDLAIGPHENASFRDVLFYAARCKTDEFGSFAATDVAAAANASHPEGFSLLALQYPLKKLTEPDRGAVLRRAVTPGGLRYCFTSQMMRHHVLVRQAEQRGLI